LLKVSHIRLKRSRSLVDVEIDFIGGRGVHHGLTGTRTPDSTQARWL
jgi:hypothetical protein